MKTVRVLHLLHSMDRGGAETMLMNYYRNLDRELVQFDFLLTKEGSSDYEEEIKSLGGRIFHITPFGITTMRTYCRELEQFFKTHPEYEIVHSHTSSKSVFPLKVAKKCGIPVRISHSHNMFLTGGSFSPKEWMRKILRGPLKKVSTHQFACSKDAAIWLYGQQYWQEGKVKIMTNAICVDQFAYAPAVRDAYRQKFGLSDQLVIGHVGQFRKQKNHEFLLRIFAEISKKREDARLVLVGDGEERTHLEQEMRQLGIEDKVILTGVREDVSSLMQMMDVFVFPSHFEGLGIVRVEAQASGLPCVASKTVIPQEVKVTDLLQFVSLQESPAVWAEETLKLAAQKNRTNTTKQIKAAGYEISQAAKEMQEFYLTCKEGMETV